MDKKKILTALFASIITLTVIGATYAYFTATAESTPQTVTLETGTMALTFVDNDAGVGGVLNFGDSITKKFTIENTGTVDAYAKLSWLNLTNPYLKGGLKYTLEVSETESGEYTKLETDKDVPVNGDTDLVLANGIEVPAGKKLYYNLVITLIYSDTVDRTQNFNATFGSQFTLENGEKPKSILETLIASSKGVAPTSLFASISPPLEKYVDNEFSGNVTSRNMSSYSSNYITYADSYTFNESTGEYTLVNPQVGQYSSIYSSLVNKYIIYWAGSTSESLETYTGSSIFKVTGSSTPSTMYFIPSGMTKVYGTEQGIYEMEDDYGTSYYFRGAVTNNYVKFAGFCWRIIRINGDGSLRLIYDGTSCHANTDTSSDRLVNASITFNSSKYDNAYVGYMYGLTGITTDVNRCLMLDSSNNVVDNVSTYTTKSACESAGGKWTTTAYEATHANVKDSTIKDSLEAWYKTNIVDKGYGDNVADTLFCGDRSMGTSNNLGYADNYTEFSKAQLLYVNKIPQPQLKCPQKNDAYTVSDETYGNGDLEYPVGLISAYEVSLAGGVAWKANEGYYLCKGKKSDYWSLSPSDFNIMFDDAKVFNVDGYGILYNDGVSFSSGVAPVINLTKEYASRLEGAGTMDIPYEVK